MTFGGKNMAEVPLDKHCIADVDAECVSFRDPVLDALIAFEESDELSHEHFYYWASVDWSKFADTQIASLEWHRRYSREYRLFVPIPRRKEARLCAVCQKRFTPITDNEYCSIKCSASRFKRAARPCSVCGEPHVKPPGIMTCSKDCEARLRRKVAYTHNGETLTALEWADRAGISEVTLTTRVRRGWDFARAIATPVQKKSVRVA